MYLYSEEHENVVGSEFHKAFSMPEKKDVSDKKTPETRIFVQ